MIDSGSRSTVIDDYGSRQRRLGWLTTAANVEDLPLGADGITPFEAQWRAAESAAGQPSPYLSFDWLAAWLDVYAPAQARVIRVTRDGDTVALGLVERQGTRWRFGGHPVTPHRGMLAAGDDRQCWSAVGAWLDGQTGAWTVLDGEGVDGTAGALPRSRLRPVQVPVIELPETFDQYLESQPGHRRRRLRQRLRYLDRAEGELTAVTDLTAGLNEFVQLHNMRAQSMGERHPQIDDRLIRMLEALAITPSVRLEVTRIVVQDETLGVAIHLGYGGNAYSYNKGIRVSAAGNRLSPGVLLELGAIRAAIEHGSRTLDLGPGEYSYKAEIGGVSEVRYELVAFSPSFSGEIAKARELVESLLRRVGPRRRLRLLVTRRG